MQASPSNPELAILRGGVEGFYTGYQTNLFSKSKNHVIQGDLSDCLKPDVITGAFTNSKVVATIGPSCQSTDVMLEMLRSGMVGARIDLTWGSLEFHHESFRNLQTAMVAAKALCCTIVDTQGREIMVRHDMNPDVPAYDTHDAPFSIATGDVVTLTTRTDIEGQANTLNVNYGNLHEMCEPGDILYIGRYLVCGAESASLYLQVTSVEASGDVLCVAQNEATMEGMLTLFHVERSVFGVSNRQNTLPLFTDRDKFCIEQLKKEFDIDFLCLSYVRDSSDVLAAREYLDSIGLEDTRLLAKISTRHSLYEFQGILNTADGIVLSRGSLGLDNHPEKMAILQKMVVKACNLVGKPVLITRLVDTMITAPRPTRAEATDVANAVLDGADGFILGAETYRGHAPADTVKMIANICRSAELVFDHKYHCEHLMEAAHGISGEGGSKTHPALNRRTPQHGGSSDSLPGRAAAHYGSAPPPAPLESSKPHEPSRLGGGGVVKKVGSAKGLRSIDQSAKNMATFGMGGSFGGGIDGLEAATGGLRSKNATSNLEAMCSSAVRCADKVKAGLIIVYTHTGETAQLVAKYRPTMPILTLVVPHLVSTRNSWQLVGRSNARQALLTRGLLPMLAAPGHEDQMMSDAIKYAASMSLVKPHDFVVCVQRVGTDVVVKILAVDALGKKATGVCEGNFAQLPGVYAANGNPMRASDADATQDSIRRPQGLISSPSMAPQH